ncbi:hypothetical protein K7H13_03475 [Qipengyuania citrea]|uniref:hypothetical protein n=1 Tax=Qipengyuania citrea TaxID=225971 RepID=UPI001E348A88|nr:hypothetical protein [Qipengyuania citrea]MCD1589823.1 hypothetical protein [Qipengyuania citrea]
MQRDDIGGYVLPVRTKRMFGGTPMLVVYTMKIPHEGGARKQLIVRQEFTDEEVCDAHPLSISTLMRSNSVLVIATRSR